MMATFLAISWVFNLRWNAKKDELEINCLSKMKKEQIDFTANNTVTIQLGFVKKHYVSRTIKDISDLPTSSHL